MTIPHLSEGTGAPRLAHKRVVIVDDHRLSSNALADSLGVRGIQVVAVEHNGSDGYRACIHHRPDALLVDFDLGLGPTGADLAISVRGEQPGLGILMFTAYEEPKLLSGSFPSLPPTVVYLVKQHVHDVDEVVQALDWSIDAASSKKLPPDRVHHFRGLTRFSGHSRLVVSSCSNHDVVVESFKLGGAVHAEAGVPAVGVIPTLNPLKHGRGEFHSAGPGLNRPGFSSVIYMRMGLCRNSIRRTFVTGRFVWLWRLPMTIRTSGLRFV